MENCLFLKPVKLSSSTHSTDRRRRGLGRGFVSEVDWGPGRECSSDVDVNSSSPVLWVHGSLLGFNSQAVWQNQELE